MLRITSFFLLILSLVLLAFGCSANHRDNTQGYKGHVNINYGISDDKIIRGKVVKKETNEILLETNGESMNISGTIIVNLEEKILANIEEGQDIIVWYDYIRESYPAQTRGLKIDAVIKEPSLFDLSG